jgi:hypothetical protein
MLLGSNPDGADRAAVVEQVSSAASKSGKIKAGHFLVGLGDVSLRDKTYYECLKAVKNSPRPVTLEFMTCNPNQSGGVSSGGAVATGTTGKPGSFSVIGDTLFSLTFGNGPLKLMLIRNEGNGLVDLGAKVGQIAPGSTGEGKVNIGDLLVKVNEVDVSVVDFDKTMAAVKKATRPVTLCFVSPPALPCPSSSNGSDIFSIYPTQVLPHSLYSETAVQCIGITHVLM